MRRLVMILCLAFAASSSEVRALSAADLATRAGEVAFGEAWLRNTRDRLGERVDPFCIDLLETWLIRLKNHFPLADMPLKGLCLSPRDFNAFAAPGGIVGVNRGVYLDLASEAEIMAVLAHELAHLSQRHHYRGLRQSERVSVGTLASLAGVLAAIATSQGQAAQSLIMSGQAANAQSALAYSRDFEREADRIGAQALTDAGYDPKALSQVLAILADKQSQLTEDLAFLSTHPLGIERQSDLDARVARLRTQRTALPIMSDTDFQLFRCVQIEGLNETGRLLETELCQSVAVLLRQYRAQEYKAAWDQWMAQPMAVRDTLTGMDLTIALALGAGEWAAAEDAIETLALFFPSWIMPTVARVDLALAQGETELPRQFREASITRPDRLDLWRALARFAESTRQNHLLFEARAWDALHHGKLEAAKTQWLRAREAWPQDEDDRPLIRLDQAIKAVEPT